LELDKLKGVHGVTLDNYQHLIKRHENFI